MMSGTTAGSSTLPKRPTSAAATKGRPGFHEACRMLGKRRICFSEIQLSTGASSSVTRCETSGSMGSSS